jgi:hypothetical protein
LENLFGSAILRYVDRAWRTDDQSQRIALCKLAVQDEAVFAAHAGNTTVISGRHYTRFRSAFLVRTPLAPERIADARRLEDGFDLPNAEITLEMIR